MGVVANGANMSVLRKTIHVDLIAEYLSIYLELDCGCSRLSMVVQMSLSQAMLSSSSWGIQRCSGRIRCVIHPAGSVSTSGSSTSWNALQRKVIRKHPDQTLKPRQLDPFDPLSKGEPNSLRPIVCRSFSPDPKRATTCEGCSVDWLVNEKLCLVAQLSPHNVPITTDNATMPLSSSKCYRWIRPRDTSTSSLGAANLE